MKCLTVCQPFASLIADGEKWIENRSWPTTYRGPLAIHAGKGTKYLPKQTLASIPTGCIIAVCTLDACVSYSQISRCAGTAAAFSLIDGTVRSWQEAFFHQYAEGPWCWILSNVRELNPPVEFRGALGIFNLPDGLIPPSEVAT